MCHICSSPHRCLRFDRAKKNTVTVERWTISFNKMATSIIALRHHHHHHHHYHVVVIVVVVVIIIIIFCSTRSWSYEKDNKTKQTINNKNNKTHHWLVNIYTLMEKWCELLFPSYSVEFLYLSEDRSSHQSSPFAPL